MAKLVKSVVRDHIPLEQGLRLLVLAAENSSRVRDHIPLEQGLRRSRLQSPVHVVTVRDHIPLEQGLRLNT